MQRDLSIAAHPILIGRKWPTHLHHWTGPELEGFLEAHRYPGHTWKHHQERRSNKAVESVATGMFVPTEVLEDDPSIQIDGAEQAETARRSEACYRAREQKRYGSCRELEVAIGYWHSDAQYMGQLKQLLETALKQRHRDGGGLSVQFADWKLKLGIDNGRKSTPGHFGAFGGRAKQLTITADNGACHEVDWAYVERGIVELLIHGTVTFDDVWFLTGVGWQPTKTVVEVLRAPS